MYYISASLLIVIKFFKQSVLSLKSKTKRGKPRSEAIYEFWWTIVHHYLSVIEVNLNFNQIMSLEKFENLFQIMQNSILVRKRTISVSASSAAGVPDFLQPAYLKKQ